MITVADEPAWGAGAPVANIMMFLNSGGSGLSALLSAAPSSTPGALFSSGVGSISDCTSGSPSSVQTCTGVVAAACVESSNGNNCWTATECSITADTGSRQPCGVCGLWLTDVDNDGDLDLIVCHGSEDNPILSTADDEHTTCLVLSKGGMCVDRQRYGRPHNNDGYSDPDGDSFFCYVEPGVWRNDEWCTGGALGSAGTYEILSRGKLAKLTELVVYSNDGNGAFTYLTKTDGDGAMAKNVMLGDLNGGHFCSISCEPSCRSHPRHLLLWPFLL